MATAPMSPADLQQQYPSEFLSFLQTEASNAVDAELNGARAAAIKAYNGEPYGDETDGRSQAVTRDVAEVVDAMQTGILGVVMSSGKAVEFETEPEMITQPGSSGQPQQTKVDYGAEATASVRYVFFEKQNGYRILHDALKAGQLEKTGIIKTYAQARRPQHVTMDVPRVAISQDANGLSLPDGRKVVAAQPAPEERQPPMPAPMPFNGLTGEVFMHQPLRHDAEVMHEVTVEQPQAPLVRDEAIPNEWFLVSGDTVELDDAPYVGECTPKSISDLVTMGYDYDTLKTLWDNAPADTVVDYARDSQRSQSRRTVGQRQGTQRRLWLYEEYPLYDLDGDGISERLFVHRIGQTILRCQPVDEQPYSGWSPFPMQHRFTGQSVADKVQDIQRIRSVLLRQGLDSMYIANAPRTLVPIDGLTEDTYDDLLAVHPGGLIRYKGGSAPQPFAQQDASQQAFAGMEMLLNERQARTGVTQLSQGLNPDVLATETASGMALLDQNSDQIQLLIVRNFVSGVVKSAFMKRYRLMRAFTPPFRMKIDGQYTLVDPSKWPDEIDVTINVGLGTGTQAERIQALNQLISTQAEAHASNDPIITDANRYEAAAAWIEASGLGSPSRFITDPSTLPPQQPQNQGPSADAVKAQGDAQLAQQESAQTHQQTMAKLQLQQQAAQASAALDAQRNETELAAKREAAQLDIQLKREKAAEEARLAQQAQDFEQSLALRRQDFNEQQAHRRAAQVESDDNLPKLRPGGSLDQ